MLESLQANGGKNANGVEIVSIVLGIEHSNFDSSIRSFQSNTGFDMAGVDCVLEGSERTAFRESFSYFTGRSPARIPSSGSRREFVILNGVANSPSHEQWQLLYRDSSYSSSDRQTILSLIDAVMPGGDPEPTGNSYDAWLASQSLPLGAAGPMDDPDGDRLTNLLEFYFGSSPLVETPNPLVISAQGDALAVEFPEALNLQGVEPVIQRSTNLIDWSDLSLTDDQWQRMQQDDSNRVSIHLPMSDLPVECYRLSVTLSSSSP